MKHNALIVLEALLLGQRVKMPTGHTLVMEDGQLLLVAEIWSVVGDEKEILLSPGALGGMDVFVRQCEEMSPQDVFVIGSQSAMIKMANGRAESRARWRAEYTGDFQPSTPCDVCGGTGQGYRVESCPACKGTGRATL